VSSEYGDSRPLFGYDVAVDRVVVLGPHPARASVPRAAPSAGLDPLQREKTPGTGYLI
jgi:hypothetical protein